MRTIERRGAAIALLLIVGLSGIAGCGSESSSDSGAAPGAGEADAEHFLSDQQKALEGSKAAAEAMAEAAAERARQTEDARN